MSFPPLPPPPSRLNTFDHEPVAAQTERAFLRAVAVIAGCVILGFAAGIVLGLAMFR